MRHGLLREAWTYLRRLKPGFSVGERLVLVGIAVVVLLLLLIAWVSPPNNYDSYLYHMARVVHWAQAGSLDHYPAGYEHQLTKPTWAETAILHLRVLWGRRQARQSGAVVQHGWIADRGLGHRRATSAGAARRSCWPRRSP